MYALQFWKSWPKPYQFLFWFMIVGLAVSVLFFWNGYLMWPAPAIVYDHFQELQSIETPVHTFQVGLTNITVTTDSYLIFESILGSNLHTNDFSLYFFLGTLLLAFVFFISIITELSRYRFLMTMGIVILFLASLQIESLEVFGITTRAVTAVLILLFGLLAFYFHAIKTDANFIQRFLNFLVLTISIGIVIFVFSKTTMPFLHIAANGLTTGIVLTLIFILMISHEIVASFVTIITRSLKSEKSLRHFLILTGIYLLNVFLMFASKMGIIDWSFFSVSPFFLVVISAVLGIWGFRQREPIHQNIIVDEPQRIYFFLLLALVSFGAMTFFASTASDMAIDALEDFIIAAHFGGGLIFALYVIANFAPMLAKNLSVYKILYKPETMPHFTFRLMAVIATFAVLSWAVSWKTYLNQLVATYYHAQADVYLSKHDIASAEKFYQKSVQFRNQNLHAHYGLASIYASKLEPIKERREYENATTWTPSVPMYLNYANTYSSHGDLLEAALTLDDGKKKFPASGEMSNALGLSFLKLKQPDSAIFFFQKAGKVSATKTIAENNLLATRAWFKLNQRTDSVVSLDDYRNNGVVANQLALANSQNQKIVVEGRWSTDTALNVYEAMTLSNYLINQRSSADTTLIRTAINLAHRNSNDVFAENLLISSANTLYDQGLVNEAFKVIREVAFGTNNPAYFSTMGLWLLEQGNPSLASYYLNAASEKSHPRALFYQAIADAESYNLTQAIHEWDSLRKSTDKSVVALAEKVLSALKAKPQQATDLSDEEKYYFCRYQISLEDKSLFEKVIGSISDERIRAQAIVDRAKKQFEIDELSEALELLNQINTSYIRNINQQVANLRLMLAAEKGDWQFIQENISKTDLSLSQRIYLEALNASQNGNKRLAEEKYSQLVKTDSYFEEGLVAATRFFASLDNANQLRNFSILVDGLLAKPNSVKILKQHALMAADLGFIDASQDSLNKLRLLLSDAAFKKFVAAYPDYFGKK